MSWKHGGPPSIAEFQCCSVGQRHHCKAKISKELSEQNRTRWSRKEHGGAEKNMVEQNITRWSSREHCEQMRTQGSRREHIEQKSVTAFVQEL